MTAPDWLWIALTIGAALAQTFRNAAQRQLTATLGTLGATLVRFLYGLPFTLAWLAAVSLYGGYSWPAFTPILMGWALLGAASQLTAAALLLQVMEERNFALGIAYSKTDAILVALFAFLILGESVAAGVALAIGIGTLGVMLLAPADPQRPLRAMLEGLTSRSALLGVGSGACFAFSGVCNRAAALSVPETHFLFAAAIILAIAQSVQTFALGGWLLARRAGTLTLIFRAWRPSLFAGCMGATASIGWFTAVAIEPIAHVRTLALIELVFVYAVSQRIFREKITRREITGMGMLAAGLLMVTLTR